MLIAGPNLTIDRTSSASRLVSGEVLRLGDVVVTPGGKGLNVARAARTLESRATLVAFVPGHTGRAAADLIAQEGVALEAIPAPGEIRSTSVVIEPDGRTTVLNEPGPAIGEAEWAALEDAVARLLPDHRVLVCSGSLPPGAPDGGYARLCVRAREVGGATVVDAGGAVLRATLDAHPDVVTPNLAEAEGLLHGRVDEAVESSPDAARRALAAAAELVERGARAAVVTAAAAGAAVADGSPPVWIAAPRVTARNPIGAGDVFTAVLADGLERGRPLLDAVRAATAAASASVETPTAGVFEPARMDALLTRVQVQDAEAAPMPDGEADGIGPARAVVEAVRPTMRHVAARAGVSLKTVSRVVNEEAGVTRETARRVSAAISELGFQPNHVARSLRRGGSSATLGLVIEDVANPFYGAIVRAVEAAAGERGHMLITVSCEEDPQRERALVSRLLRRRVDALLLVPTMHERDHSWLPQALGADTPVVFLDRPPHGAGFDTVLFDNVGGAQRAVAHLIGHGHERIAFVGDARALHTTHERLAGYEKAMRESGLRCPSELVRTGSHDPDEAEAVTGALLDQPPGVRPTALFTANNRHTIGALRALRRRRLDDEVALVGFDDFELADLLQTTVVRSDPLGMGSEAAALAFARLDGDASPARRVIVAAELIPRGSGEVRAAP